MARPQKWNPEWKQKQQVKEEAYENGQIEKLLTALKSGLSRSSAIVFSGLKRGTVYDWLEKDLTFRQKVEDAEEYWVWIVENEKRKKIQDEHYRPAIEKELESVKFERYWKKVKNEVKVEWYNLKDMSEEDLLKLIKGGE